MRQGNGARGGGSPTTTGRGSGVLAWGVCQHLATTQSVSQPPCQHLDDTSPFVQLPFVGTGAGLAGGFVILPVLLICNMAVGGGYMVRYVV